ncbi:TraR/DksA family transcriptional regulator [Usitatibacter palustris]|uniref:RNA polymerase-binding transcription factor DksA n=1 Tax=Usitatibacter palustris TaxID=2732487 RepID=A0A6M4H4N3_9PROT|nr:TraR/DksA C4-type zinc finger protein [Usitatibacter palustris]QJR14232.1 RNA polymerase-binding transcription factor DksA [Usitatibacter palustris]
MDDALRTTLRGILERRAHALRREMSEAFHHSASGEITGVEADTQLAGVERDAAELERVERAITRSFGPQFGTCADCYSPIARERLVAEPFAERCLACEAQRERREPSAHASL